MVVYTWNDWKFMTRLIKKYKNRRLYDTTSSKYITIEDLQKFVLEGIDFEVKDSETDKDITNQTLLQILVEIEAGSTKLLSSLLLRQLIVMSNHPMHKNFTSMLEQMLQNFDSQMDSNYLNDVAQFTNMWGKNMEQFFKGWNTK